MGWNGTNITPPVNSDDVLAATGYDNHDWGHFCSGLNGGINKWSLWKPYRCAGLASPSNLQVAGLKFGIDVLTNTRLTGLEDSVRSASNTQSDPAAIQPHPGAYYYIKPTGGDASPHRITDFADNDDASAPAGLQFKRWYNAKACAPDQWRDWVVSEADLTAACSESVPVGVDKSPTWSLPGSARKYQDCGIRMGAQSQETIGDTSTYAMPLTYLFGNDTIAGEKWRIGLAVYLPYGTSTNSKAQWMAFAGLKPLSVSNGGQCLPDMKSNIVLCQAIYHNFKNKGVTDFTFIPCILCNSSLAYTANNQSVGVVKVDLKSADSSKLLQTPTFRKCKLTITATPKPGQPKYYSDSSFRGWYSTNISTGVYKICVGKITGTTNQTLNFDYYKVQILGSLKIENAASGYGSTGNLKVTASGNAVYKKYASQTEYNNDKTASLTGTSSTCANVAQWFYSYVAASAPSSVSPYLEVTKL